MGRSDIFGIRSMHCRASWKWTCRQPVAGRKSPPSNSL